MDLDATMCYCFHVPKRKIVNFIKQRQPKRASMVSECFGAGTGCGWCIPFLIKLHGEMMEGRIVEADDITPEEYEAMRSNYRKDVAKGIRDRNRHGHASPALGTDEYDEPEDDGPEHDEPEDGLPNETSE